MNPDNPNAVEAKRQELLGHLNAAEAALRSNLNLNCANVTARVHMQRALAHIQEASIAVNGVRRARTVWQLVEDLTKFKHNSDELQPEPAARSTVRVSH